MQYIIFRTLFCVVIIIGIIAIVSYKFFCMLRKAWKESEKQESKKKSMSYEEKVEKIFIWIVKGGAFALAVVFISVVLDAAVIPFFRDLPYIFEKDYSEFQGFVVNHVSQARIGSEPQTLTIESPDGEEMRISVIAKGVERGDYIIVEYLPYTKLGAVTKIISKEEIEDIEALERIEKLLEKIRAS